ncbi:hypothetical protein COCCADRAFT_40146 [Bipolaris zeicola 26-R-13]|uniref:Uncharacterized protein n=1 Tax=Cochliobolus carbonum (strain 26-R-13) TaxID=930089 RepID=W6Y300_COCC2|nr:uncharacterized protein COCCADRAFT_40146 [Bipolaris zeicola 26-R-13]EUC29459.1 hypothetical protein COCCADRAFT_40146 [Bipolaris zeicola 26-R-13]
MNALYIGKGSTLRQILFKIALLIIVTGHAKLLAGERLLEVGSSENPICHLDIAGSCGGTKYRDRHPGLQCDVEGCICISFPEETSFKSLQKCSSSDEICRHWERVASHFGLGGQSSTRVLGATCNDGRRCEEMAVFTPFLVPTGTLFASPRMPNVDGFDELRVNIPAIDDDKWVSEVATGPVWQFARQLNFDTLFNGEEDSADHPDLVADGWTKMARGFLGFIAGPRHVTLKRSTKYVQPFCLMWCKRPTFQDEYLPTFNQPHVTLVNTDSKGIERCISWGVIAKGVEYELNVLILATGFLLALGGNIAPAELFGIPIAGRSGRHLKDKYGLLCPGLGGGPGSINLTIIFDLKSKYMANILKEAVDRLPDPTQLVTKPTREYSVLFACTPSYFNHKGDALLCHRGTSTGLLSVPRLSLLS